MPDITITITLTKAELVSLGRRVEHLQQLRGGRYKLRKYTYDNLLIRLWEARPKEQPNA